MILSQLSTPNILSFSAAVLNLLNIVTLVVGSLTIFSKASIPIVDNNGIINEVNGELQNAYIPSEVNAGKFKEVIREYWKALLSMLFTKGSIK